MLRLLWPMNMPNDFLFWGCSEYSLMRKKFQLDPRNNFCKTLTLGVYPGTDDLFVLELIPHHHRLPSF